MNHELSTTITRELAQLQTIHDRPYQPWLFTVSFLGGFIGGVGFIGGAIRSMETGSEYYPGLVYLFLGFFLIASSVAAFFKRLVNRRFRIIYEALLEWDKDMQK